MRKRLFYIILLLSVISTISVNACECVSRSFTEEANQTDYIFIGTALDKYSYNEMHYQFSIQTVFKGARVDTVLTGFGSGDCGAEFKLGETYLIYVTNGRTTACRRNQLVAESADVGRLFYLFDKDFAVTIGQSNEPLLTENEAIYLNHTLQEKTLNFSFAQKQIGFVETDCAITKQTFFEKYGGRNISAGLIILSEQEKQRFGDYDAILVACRKRLGTGYSRAFRKRAARRVARLAN